MQLCLTCAAKVRQAFPRKELKQVGESEYATCDQCRQKRYCVEYELVEKEKL